MLIEFKDLESRIEKFYKNGPPEATIMKRDDDILYGQLKKQYFEDRKCSENISLYDKAYIFELEEKLRSDPSYPYLEYDWVNVAMVDIGETREKYLDQSSILEEFKKLEEGVDECFAARDYYRNYRLLYWLKSIQEDHEPILSQIQWIGDQSEFIELAYSIIEAEVIKYDTRKEVIAALSKFFNFEVKNPAQTLQGIKNKRPDNPTILLDKLKKAFESYLNKDL